MAALGYLEGVLVISESIVMAVWLCSLDLWLSF